MWQRLLLKTPVYYLSSPACVQQRTDAIGNAVSVAGIIDRRGGAHKRCGKTTGPVHRSISGYVRQQTDGKGGSP